MRLLTLLTRRWVKVGVAVTSITAMALPALALSAPAGASPTPAPTITCPSIGEDAAPACGYVITIGPNATDTAYVGSIAGPNQGPYDGSDDVIVGIVNDTDALVSSVTLSGSGDLSGAQDIFGFDGDGMCTEPPYQSWCSLGQQEGEDSSDGPYPLGWDYVGQDNAFSNPTDYNVQGTVNFTTPLPPGGSTFFSLEEGPTSVVSVDFASDISVSATPVSGTEGLSTGPVQVATFSDGPNTSPVTDFTATTNWGDSPSPSTSSITQPDGTGTAYVVTDSHTYLEEGSDTTTVTVSDNLLSSTNVGSASSTATIADAPLSPTATQPAIANATTNKSFTAVVGTFLDANPSAPITDYTTSPGGAEIYWGDTNSSPGTVSLVSPPNGTSPTEFEVTGTHTYAANGTYTISVVVTDVGHATTTLTNQVSDYDAVITCSSSPCSGTATSSTQTTGASTTSTTGTILLDLNNVPVSGAFSCNDPFRHAVQYSTILENGLSASGSVDISITFANSAAGGFWLDPFAVCFKSPGAPFTDLFGQSVTLGLLPICPLARPGHPVVGPCVQSIYYSTIFPLPSEKGTVTENLIIPPNDPLSH
jgi:hypothetical protein